MIGEGMGIYITLNPAVAKFYGDYIYSIEIPDVEVIDLRQITEIKKYLALMITYTNPNNVDRCKQIINELPLGRICKMLFDGDLSFYLLPMNLEMSLEGLEDWLKIGKTVRQRIYSKFRAFNRKYLKTYFYNSREISSVGVIKDVTNARIIKVTDTRIK